MNSVSDYLLYIDDNLLGGRSFINFIDLSDFWLTDYLIYKMSEMIKMWKSKCPKGHN